jgi:hypothetical protein
MRIPNRTNCLEERISTKTSQKMGCIITKEKRQQWSHLSRYHCSAKDFKLITGGSASVHFDRCAILSLDLFRVRDEESSGEREDLQYNEGQKG